MKPEVIILGKTIAECRNDIGESLQKDLFIAEGTQLIDSLKETAVLSKYASYLKVKILDIDDKKYKQIISYVEKYLNGQSQRDARETMEMINELSKEIKEKFKNLPLLDFAQNVDIFNLKERADFLEIIETIHVYLFLNKISHITINSVIEYEKGLLIITGDKTETIFVIGPDDER